MFNAFRKWLDRSDNVQKERYQEFNTERLERREMLAGDVSVSVRGGDLVIRGDAAGNEIQISRSSQSRGLLVTGENGTTVNGQASYIAVGVSDDIRVNLKGGNDRLTLRNLSTNDLKFVGSHGEDVLALDNLNVRGNLKVSMGGGTDVLYLTRATVVGSTRIKTSHGGGGVIVANSWMRGQVRVNLGHSRDALWVAESRFDQDVSAKLKGGGDDVLLVDNQFFGSAKFHGGHGFDDIALIGIEPPGFDAVSFEGDSPSLGTL